MQDIYRLASSSMDFQGPPTVIMPRRGALLCGRPRYFVRSRRVRLFLFVCLGTLVLCGAFTAVFLVASVRRFDIQKVIDDAAGDNDGVSVGSGACSDLAIAPITGTK